MDTVHSLFVRLDMRTHVRVRMHARVQISRVFLHLLDINRLQNYSAIGFIFFTFFYFFSFHHYWPASFFFPVRAHTSKGVLVVTCNTLLWRFH